MRKRIIHCIDKLHGGGAQTQLIHLCNNTDRRDYKIAILCFDPSSVLNLEGDIDFIVIKKRSGLFLLISWYEIFKEIKIFKPDILQLWLPEIITIPAVFAGIFCRNCFILSCSRRIPIKKIGLLWFRDRLKYIAHGLASKMTTNFPMPLKFESIFNMIYKYRKGEVIFNGLDINFLSKYNVRNKYIGGQLNLIYTGRLTYQKNVNLLILAINELINKGYAVKLEIYGQGEDEEMLKRMVEENNLGNHINFNGFNPEWFKLSGNAHAFITASNLEGMPNVLFEAIAIGLPVLASNIEEISHHFTNNYDAMLFEVNSVQAITVLLEKIIRNPSLLDIIYHNACNTIQQYSISEMVDKYTLIYKNNQ